MPSEVRFRRQGALSDLSTVASAKVERVAMASRSRAGGTADSACPASLGKRRSESPPYREAALTKV